MSYANGTTHYNLPQTLGTDKRDWTDTNQAFSDVDTALYGAVQDAETATSGIQTLNAAVETINGKLATDEGNISTLSGKVSTLESTVSGHTTAIADVRQDLQDNIESNHEASATSTHLYNVGDTFYYNDVLYKATAQIAIGGTIVPSTNCIAITVMSEIDTLNDIVDSLQKNDTDVSDTVSIIDATAADPYVCPSDGYMRLDATAHSGNAIVADVLGASGGRLCRISAAVTVNAIYVRKGTKLAIISSTGSDNGAQFTPFE